MTAQVQIDRVGPQPDGVSSGKIDTLLPVIRTIPKGCYENPVWKGMSAVVAMATAYAIVLVLLARTDRLVFVLPLWGLVALVISGLFVLAHDAAHQSLFASKRLNKTVARILMLPMLHVYEGWVLGHNRIHHGHTVRRNMDFIWQPMTVEEYRNLSPFRRFRHRVEWGPFGSGFYYMREVWWNKMITFTPPRKYKRAIRRDLLFVAGFFVTVTAGLITIGAAHYGTIAGGVWLWAKLVIVPAFLFMFTIGWAVYVHHIAEDIEWWPRREWTSLRGQLEGTTILHAPKLLNIFFLNIFLHVPHHVDMRIPFYQLPAASRAIVAEFGPAIKERPLRMRDYLRNARHCKLYDYERQHWLTYAEAREQV